MKGFLDYLEQSIVRRQLFHNDRSILIAVSGGVDSMVLLDSLHELAPKHGWKLVVVHFNHQLRGQASNQDERLVRRTARKLGLPVAVKRANVRKFATEQKLSLEMSARKLRHDFLAETAVTMKIPAIALAHHADDQLELFFLRLLRGTGGEGLAGMKWRNVSPSNPAIELIRPFLDLPKSELMRYAIEKKIAFREDRTNRSLNFPRNRIRHELLPLLRRRYQPALDKTVLRTMEVIAAEADFVNHVAKAWLKRCRKRAAGRRDPSQLERKSPVLGVELETRFDCLPLAVQRRCVQVQLLNLEIEPAYDLVECLRVSPNRRITVFAPLAQPHASFRPEEAGAKSPKMAFLLRLGGAARADAEKNAWVPVQVSRDESGLIQLQEQPRANFQSSAYEFSLAAGAGKLRFDQARIQWKVDSAVALTKSKNKVRTEHFDADKVGSRILLRHWRPGDRFQPIGMSKPVKLQDLFTNAKVPREHRHILVIAAAASGEIFWVENLRISERFKLTKQTMRCLHWRWHRVGNA